VSFNGSAYASGGRASTINSHFGCPQTLLGGTAMKLLRRTFLHLAAGASALPAVSRFAWAQSYPTKPITIIVPFAAGGPADVTTRIIAEHMSRTLGQPLLVENVGGAGGTTGSTRAMRANPDGHTIMMGHVGTHAVSVALYPKLAYRPDVDFAPIGVAVDQAVLIVGKKDFPPKDLAEFVSYVKSHFKKLNTAHAGVGSITHFTGVMLNSILGVDPVMVPFTGAGPAMNALIGGQVDYMCSPIPDVVQQVLGGKIKAYAIGSAERSLVLPDIPTSKEAGLPNFQALAWFSFFAPKDVPKPILDQLSDALDKALDDENVRKRLLDLGCDIPNKSKRGQQPLAALVKSELARWSPIITATSN
jgi:tripartite-type tricarboxylate transporter receptor subunit TctC